MTIDQLKEQPPPHGVSEQQAIDIIAWYWIVDPQMMYKGLSTAFGLAPSDKDTVQ
jgi:hypothetical protein